MKINIKNDDLLKIVQIVLLVVILVLVLWMQPWNSSSSSTERTIEVSGEATIEATPDEFVFYPYFEATGTNNDETKEQLLDSVNAIVEELKALGVASEDITLNANSLDRLYVDEGEEAVLSVSLEIKTDDEAIAESVQNFLVGKNAKGQVSPLSSISKQKQEQLEKEALSKASENARANAESKAALFGATIGDAISISDTSSGGVFPQPFAIAEDGSAESSEASLPFQPGQEEYTLTVYVTYELQ